MDGNGLDCPNRVQLKLMPPILNEKIFVFRA